MKYFRLSVIFLLFIFSVHILHADQVTTESGLRISIKKIGEPEYGYQSFEVTVKNLTDGPKSLSGTIHVYAAGTNREIGSGTVFISIKPNKEAKDEVFASVKEGVSPGK